MRGVKFTTGISTLSISPSTSARRSADCSAESRAHVEACPMTHVGQAKPSATRRPNLLLPGPRQGLGADPQRLIHGPTSDFSMPARCRSIAISSRCCSLSSRFVCLGTCGQPHHRVQRTSVPQLRASSSSHGARANPSLRMIQWRPKRMANPPRQAKIGQRIQERKRSSSWRRTSRLETSPRNFHGSSPRSTR